MRPLGPACSALISLAAVASICGCSGVSPTGLAAATAAAAPHGRSWMAKGATSGPLLYITTDGGTIYVVTYPQGTLVGQLTGVDEAQGLCSDALGNVFVTSYGGEDVIEFAHGGTSPIAKLGDYGYYPNGCAIDPKTGNLAVANTNSMDGSAGNVAIYKQAQGKPTNYGQGDFYWCAYDGQGDLLLGGRGGGYDYLPAGSSTPKSITLEIPGEGIHWDGSYFAIVDPNAKQVDQVLISGSSGNIVNQIKFTGLFYTLGYDFALTGGKIILPYDTKQQGGPNKVATGKYPQGGRLARPFKIGGNYYYAMALSL